MNRREFLVHGGSILLVVPVGWTIAGCDSSNSSGVSPTNTNNNTGNSAGALQFMSSVVAGHSHDFTINMTDLTQPPAAGVSGPTTVSAAHQHTVTLTAADLAQIQAGQNVTKTTSVEAGHDHNFQFSRAAGTPVGGTTGQGGADGGAGTGGAGGASGSGGATGTGGANGGGTGTGTGGPY